MADKRFGKEVKKALVDRDMTQLELARLLGCHHRYLGLIVNGQRGPGKYEQRIRSILDLGQTNGKLAG